MSEWSWLDITAISALSAIIGYFIGAKVTKIRMIMRMLSVMQENERQRTSGIQSLRTKLDTLTDDNAADVLTEIGEQVGMRVLKADAHANLNGGQSWYLYDLKGNFVCQGRDAEEVAFNFRAVSPPGMNAVVLDSDDQVQWRFQDGTIHHGAQQ